MAIDELPLGAALPRIAYLLLVVKQAPYLRILEN